MYAVPSQCRYVRPSLPMDSFVAFYLRKEDEQEVWTSSQKSPFDVLFSTLYYQNPARSNYTMLSPKTGVPFGVFGVVSDGLIWMLSTKEIEHCSITFLRESKKWIDYFHKYLPCLWNYVDARQTIHIKWLTKWLGFQDYGRVMIHSHPFITMKHYRKEG